METVHKSHTRKGLSRRERRLIKKQNATIKKKAKGRKRILASEPEPEAESQEILISQEIMESVRRILKEFKPKKTYGLVPIGISSQNHCTYSEATYYEFGE